MSKYEKLSLNPSLQGKIWLSTTCTRERHSHQHEELEVNLVMRGSGIYVLNGKSYTIKPGTMLWLFPDQEHVLIDGDEGITMWIIVFSRELLGSILCRDNQLLQAWDPEKTLIRQVSSDKLLDLDKLNRSLTLETDNKDLYNAGLKYLLFKHFALFNQENDNIKTETLHPAIEKSLRLLERDPVNYSLESLAEKVGLSPGRLSRVFSRQTGISVTEYKNQLKLRRFFRNYREFKDVSRAAIQSGFGSYPQFYRYFKKAMGTGPRQWFN